MTDVGVVVLSMGNRPHELDRLLTSLLQQQDVTADVLVVGNGWQPTGLPDGVRSMTLPTNIGIPAGRNAGATEVDGDILLFADDDLQFTDRRLLAAVVAEFHADPRLGVLQPRAVEPDSTATARRHVPRVGSRGSDRPGDVAWFWEGCSFLRRSMFVSVGCWPGEFVYGHEGIEVAWRAIDGGYRIHYAADLHVVNPPAEPFRRPEHRFTDARNRVWVARRNLPHPMLELYLLVWMVGTFARLRRLGEMRVAARGFWHGLRSDPGERRPIRWRAVVHMARLGRPPII